MRSAEVVGPSKLWARVIVVKSGYRTLTVDVEDFLAFRAVAAEIRTQEDQLWT